eukprot:s356_g20.t2
MSGDPPRAFWNLSALMQGADLNCDKQEVAPQAPAIFEAARSAAELTVLGTTSADLSHNLSLLGCASAAYIASLAVGTAFWTPGRSGLAVTPVRPNAFDGENVKETQVDAGKACEGDHFVPGSRAQLCSAIVAAAVVSLLRQAADLLEAAANHGEQGETVVDHAPSDHWSLLGASPRAASGSPPAANCPGILASAGYNTYEEVANSIPPLPHHSFDLCSRLAGPDPPVFRARRAWQAGHWARAVVEGKIVKPRPTAKITQRSTVYIIVQGPGIDKPVRVASAARYYQLVPKFSETSLSHGWPSQAEAQVYCLALGIDFPAEA